MIPCCRGHRARQRLQTCPLARSRHPALGGRKGRHGLPDEGHVLRPDVYGLSVLRRELDLLLHVDRDRVEAPLVRLRRAGLDGDGGGEPKRESSSLAWLAAGERDIALNGLRGVSERLWVR